MATYSYRLEDRDYSDWEAKPSSKFAYRTPATKKCLEKSKTSAQAASLATAIKRRISVKDCVEANFYTRKLYALRNDIPFDIEFEDLIIPTHCPLLGLKLVASGKGAKSPATPSIDKIIPELGYVKGNVCIISFAANHMKSNATKQQLLQFARNIESYLESAEKHGP